jgi:hypothetical protein
MDIRALFLGTGDFKSRDEIIRMLSRENNSGFPLVDANKAEALLIFQTYKQQTWLVADAHGLYCVLDDFDRSFTRAQWFIPYNDLIKDGNIVGLKTTENSENTGLLNIGPRRNWLFSKKLFTSEDIESSIKRLVNLNVSMGMSP